MAFESGALDTTISAAAGNDPELFAELHEAFRESVARQVDLLGRARCDGNWRVAAMRLKGLAATFHADPLIDLADAALEAAPGEPTVVRALREYVDELAGS
ncbi:MAG: Hpt domain-containing protein [Sphingomonadaceae bacterium]